MKSKIKYIILVSDNNEGTELLLEMMNEIARTVKTDIVKSFTQLFSLVAKKLPELIIMHFKKPGDGYSNFLAKIRKNKKMDKIPVLIYPVLPEKQDLLGFLKQL
jgi:CheY-like chemotaxis protein